MARAKRQHKAGQIPLLREQTVSALADVHLKCGVRLLPVTTISAGKLAKQQENAGTCMLANLTLASLNDAISSRS